MQDQLRLLGSWEGQSQGSRDDPLQSLVRALISEAEKWGLLRSWLVVPHWPQETQKERRQSRVLLDSGCE